MCLTPCRHTCRRLHISDSKNHTNFSFNHMSIIDLSWFSPTTCALRKSSADGLAEWLDNHHLQVTSPKSKQLIHEQLMKHFVSAGSETAPTSPRTRSCSTVSQPLERGDAMRASQKRRPSMERVTSQERQVGREPRRANLNKKREALHHRVFLHQQAHTKRLEKEVAMKDRN